MNKKKIAAKTDGIMKWGEFNLEGLVIHKLKWESLSEHSKACPSPVGGQWMQF